MSETGIVLRSGRALRKRSPRRPAIKTSVIASALQSAFKVAAPQSPAGEQVQFSGKIDPQLLRPFNTDTLPATGKPILPTKPSVRLESKWTFWTVALVFSALVSLWLWSFWLTISSPEYNLTMDANGGLSISQTTTEPLSSPEYTWPEPPLSRGWPR